MSYKLLFIAYACGPGRGSEWGLGWHYVEDLARTQPVWLITHSDNRELIDPYLRDRHKGHPVHVTYVKLPEILGWMRNSFYTLYNIQYYLWQFAAARAARRIHRQVKLDLVQHVSLFRWWMPSAGATLANKGVGFIFGPVGGGDTMPKGFTGSGTFKSRFGSLLRVLGRDIWRHDPLLKRTIRRAHLLLAGVPSCEEWFKRYGGKNIETVCSAIAGSTELQLAATEARATREPDQPFTFASCGGLNYYRGVDLAIKAFAKANLPNARYIHLCDGPMREPIQKYIDENGLQDRVKLMGDMPHIDCVRHVARADACVHTVLRDSQGLLVEAMLAGVPVITLDHLTPAMMVDESCGVKLPIDDSTTPAQLIDQLAAVMKDWYENRAQLAPMGQAAIGRAHEFTAEAKGVLYRSLHHRVLHEMHHAPVTHSVSPARGMS